MDWCAVNCMCPANVEVIEEELMGGSAVEAVAGEMLRKGRISENEYTEIIKADQLYVAEQEAHVLRPRRSPAQSPRAAVPPPPPRGVGDDNNPTAPPLVPPVPPSEARDPITLEPLGTHTYEFKFSSASNAASVRYNLDSLVQYLVVTGNFHEPTTRVQLTEQQVLEIDRCVSKGGLKLESVLSAYKNQTKYSSQRSERELTEGLERCVSEVVASMLDMVEQKHPCMESAEIKLVGRFEEFDHFFSQLRSRDATYARQCAEQYREFMQGPPNRRTKPNRLLKAVLKFLDEKTDRPTTSLPHPIPMPLAIPSLP